jgi:hypothetical protein
MLEYGWNILIANVGKHDIPFHATHLNDHFQNQLLLLSHTLFSYVMHSYDILGARMLWKPKEARILKNFIEF